MGKRLLKSLIRDTKSIDTFFAANKNFLLLVIFYEFLFYAIKTKKTKILIFHPRDKTHNKTELYKNLFFMLKT